MNDNFKTKFSTTINAPLEKVWEALTNPEIFKQYFFGTQMITDWKVGSDIVFQGEWEGHKYRDHGKIMEYVFNDKLTYTYLSSMSNMEDKPENYLLVSYEVKPHGNETELIISQTNYDEEKAKHSEKSWEAIVEGLRKVVEAK